MQNAIEVKNLKVVFPDRGRMIRAVEGVDLTVKKGECLALVGESGCGKSMTSLSCMKLQPSLAAVRLDQLCICGEDVTDYTDRQMQALRGSKISMIFQDALTALNPVMTIGKQMDEIYRCHEKISKKEAKMRSIKALKAVGIPDAELRYHAFPHELSGGMRQRVLIAMAFACEPEVIIADEPTTALDVTIQAQILELLSKMQKEKQTALLLITHDLSVVRSMADRIAVMYSGKIVEEAPAKELLENPLHPYTKGLMAAVARLDDDDADESRTCQRTNTETHVKTNIAITWTQVDKVAETNSDDTSHSNCRQQTARNAEDGGEAHGRYGCCYGIFPVGMMGRHGKVGHKIVDVAHLYGECNTESHSQYHQQCVEGSYHSHFDIAVYHVAYEIDKWHSRYDKQSAGHQRMPWCGREHEAW